MEEIDLLGKNLNKENSKENKVKLKLKEYFTINEKLFHQNFNSFLEFIGLSDIWSTEKEQNILWDSIMAKATDKENIDYDAASSAISTFLDEDDNCEIDDIFDDKIDNINIKDINLDNSDLNLFGPKNNKENKDNKNNEINENGKFIDEFLNTFNYKQDILYYIRFINEIFLSKSTITNFDRVYKDDNGNNDKIKINYDEIQNKIKNDYNFINISDEVLKNYLNYIKVKVTENKIEDGNEINKNNEYYLDKNLIKYTNAVINLKIGENNKNNINNSNINNNNNNNILNSNDKSKNINSIELNIEKLISSDKNIISCINGVISLNSNSDFLKIAKTYIENYIINLRKSIYEEIKQKELEYQQKISLDKSNTSNACNICKKSIEIENKKLNEEMKNILKRNSKLIQLNRNRSSNNMIDLNEIIEKDENSSCATLRSSLSMPRKNSKISQNIIISNKNKLNMPQKSTDNLLILKSETYMDKAKSRLKLMQQNKNITGLNKSIYSSVDGYVNNEDVTNSRIDLFSNKGNVNKDQFLLDTTGLYTEVLEDDDKTTNNNNKNKNNLRFINKDEILKKNIKDPRKSYNNIMDIFSENNDFDYEDIDDSFYNGKIHSSNNFFLKKKTMDDNYINNSDFYLGEDENLKNSDLNIFQSLKSIDNCYNTFAYGPLNSRSMSKISGLEDNNYINMNRAINNFYDYKYLSNSNKIKKILALNNEKINLHEFFTEEICSYFSRAKKEKCVLMITSHSFYFLKSDSLECVFRTNLKLLESITISSNNFNLLLVSFKGGKDIILESLQRIQILIFIKRVLSKRNLDNQIKVSSSNKFCIRKSNGKKETILTFKNKMFNLTPNFENAQKVGLLLKYQDSMFSARFNEKLVALCSIGLVYFSDNSKSPKEIIPIIGTAIKPIIVMQGSDKIYCLKFTTINEEKYIFGSLIKRELLDWKKEISYFIKMYNIQMKSINPNFSRKSSKFNEKGKEDIFESNHGK